MLRAVKGEMSGKTVLVTGATSGIGFEASVALARLGAEVVMVGRDRARGEIAVARAKERSASRKISLLECDFASQAAIRSLAKTFLAEHPKLHVLINNAGTVSPARRLTEDGIELTFAVNHLGYFLLTMLLLDRIRESAPARIVNVSSAGHYSGELDFDDLHLERGYFIMRAYNRAKLANVLFTRELARRLAGSGVTVNCLHPGMVATAIWSKAPWFARPFLAIGKKLLMITPEEGGSRIVHLAVSPEVEGKTGGYYDRNREVRPSRLAEDDALARRLWDESLKLVRL